MTTQPSLSRETVEIATSGAGDWTPVLRAGELRAGAGELPERGLEPQPLVDPGAAAGAGELGDVGPLAERGAAAQVEGHVGRW
ncbi:hypothetical protein WME91_33930 [Sorangium sp. So ce269]